MRRARAPVPVGGSQPADAEDGFTIVGAVDSDIDGEIERAMQLIEKMEYEGAVELLRGVCREQPNDYARRLLVKAETGFVSAFKIDDSFVAKVPVLMRTGATRCPTTCARRSRSCSR